MAGKISIVFAGGGCRTAWAVGILEELRKELPPVREWAGVSAGSCMAVAFAAGRVGEMFDFFLDITSKNPRNVYLERFFGKGKMFPHEPMYRATIAHALKDGGFEKLRNGAPVRTLLAYVEAGRPVLRTALGAVFAYNRRKKDGIVHGPEENHPGIGMEVRDCREGKTEAEVIETVLRSSATPPVTGTPRENGRTYIDGGFVDNVPVRALSPEAQQGKTFVLLTRPMPKESLPQSSGRFYLAPPQDVPIQKWDYTSPIKLRATYEMGRASGRTARDAVLRWLS
ncbi:MAG: patatin-like phospholipase family protein [Bdellovibrionota bacterium]